jgi:hypothetical protein
MNEIERPKEYSDGKGPQPTIVMLDLAGERDEYFYLRETYVGPGLAIRVK